MYDLSDDVPIPQCVLCGWELHGANYSRLACRRCEDRLYASLNDVFDLWLRLPSAAYRRLGAPQPGRAAAVHPGLPGNAAVLSLTGGGDDTPAGRLVAVEDDWRIAQGLVPRGQVGRPEAALRTAVVFLRNHLGWACGPHLNPRVLADGTPLLPDVEALAGALRTTLGELRAAIEQASSAEPRPRSITVACRAEFDDGRVCGSPIRVGVRELGYLCPGCGARWEREHFLKLADNIDYFGAAA